MTAPFDSKNRFELSRRLTPLLVVFVLFLLLVVVRVLYLQVGMGEELKRLSQVNRIQHQIIPARRGLILDRNGRILAADEPVFNLRTSNSTENIRSTKIQNLADGLNVDPHTLKQSVFKSDQEIVLRGLSDKQRIWFAENSARFPNFDVKIRPSRVYRYGDRMAPVLGYTGKIEPSQLSKRRNEGLSQGEIVGKTGIEKTYDSTLRGHDGIRWIETTATGDMISVLDSPAPIKPRQGDSIWLNIDVKLQSAIAHSFPADSAGAAVVMEIPSGKIRALYSHPSYNPNEITLGDPRQVNKLLSAKGDPLHNRVIQSRFPPGSTFKLFPFSAAVLESDYSPKNRFNCTGTYRLGNQEFRCWREHGHGQLNLYQALIHSCNVHFYKLIREIGWESVLDMTDSFEYSKPTGIDLPDEANSQISTPKVKQRLSGVDWVGGDALNAVIGQGFTLVSPIKQAQLLGALLTQKLVVPRIKRSQSPKVKKQLEFPETVRNKLIRTMDDVTDSGTGYWAQHDTQYQRIPVDVFGKTGTVQNYSNLDREDTAPVDAWFVAAAPTDDPRYVVVVFRSDAESGGKTAAPHARQIFTRMIDLGYFRLKKTEL